MNLNTPKKKKYKVQIVGMQAGDPTIKFSLKNEVVGTIPGLRIASMNLSMGGQNHDKSIFQDYLIGNCTDDEVMIMKSFFCEKEPGNEGINCTFSLSSEDDGEFTVTGPDQYNIQPSSDEPNTFTCVVPYELRGEDAFKLEAGMELVFQARDETGHLTFLNATGGGQLELRSIFNSLLHKGAIWNLESGSEEDNFYLKCQGEDKYSLKGNVEDGTLSLEATSSTSLDYQWQLPFKGESTNNHRVMCANSDHDLRYLHKSVSDDSYNLCLADINSVESKTITWYVHNLVTNAIIAQ